MLIRETPHENLRETDVRLRVALEGARLGLWEYDVATGELECTAECKANFGLAPDASLTYERLLAAIHSDDRPAMQASVAEAVQNGTRYECEYRIAWPDGSEHWIRASGRTVGEADCRRLVGVTLDVTDTKRLLRASSRLAEALGELAGALEPEAVTKIVCRAARELAGADGATFVVREDETVHYVDEDATGPLWKGQHFPIDACVSGWAIRERRPAVIEDIYDDERVPTAAYRPTFVRSMMMVPVRLAEPVGAIGLYWSTPHRVSDHELETIRTLAHSADLAFAGARHTQALRLARDDAERASRLKDEFLATVSHELRTPLNSMLGWVRMLRSGKLDTTTTARALATVERNTVSQAQLIEDLLDVSRIVTGKLQIDVRPVDLEVVVASAVDSTRPAAEAKDVRLRVVLESIEGTVLGDAERLQQIVWNLASNAVKFTERGGEIEVRLSQTGSSVEIVVADTGSGIVPEFLPHVFDRFSQADGSTTRAYGGLGLGLAIVRHLVEVHGGTVRAASDGAGRGATFVVSLPLTLASAGSEAVERARAAQSAGLFDAAPELSGLDVLVVDDEPDTCSLVAHVLSACDAEVRTAASGAEALEAISSRPPDVLVSDIGMQGLDGVGLIARVRETDDARGRYLPALALTAFARAEDRVRLLAAGFDAHLAKPAEPAEIATLVERLARSSDHGERSRER